MFVAIASVSEASEGSSTFQVSFSSCPDNFFIIRMLVEFWSAAVNGANLYSSQLFDVAVDGEYFCSVRYSQLRYFHNQVR